jgi:hypothetical protein
MVSSNCAGLVQSAHLEGHTAEQVSRTHRAGGVPVRGQAALGRFSPSICAEPGSGEGRQVFGLGCRPAVAVLRVEDREGIGESSLGEQLDL